MTRLVRIALLLALMVLFAAYACFPVGRPLRLEVAPGYRGWFGVQFDNPACPAIGQDGLTWVITVPENGCGCVSNSLWRLWRIHSVVYIYPDGRHEDAPDVIAGSTGPTQVAYRYPRGTWFIGSRDDVNTSRLGSEVDLDRRCFWVQLPSQPQP